MKNTFKKAPLWQWILILALVIAIPLLFSYSRDSQTEVAIQDTDVNNP